MDELPFAPILIGLQWWESAFETLRQNAKIFSPTFAPQNRSPGAPIGSSIRSELSGVNEALDRQIVSCRDQTDCAISAARVMADAIRHSAFVTFAATAAIAFGMAEQRSDPRASVAEPAPRKVA